MKIQTKESQYSSIFETSEKNGTQHFGKMYNEDWINDPKRVIFSMSRYKFVSKMFSGYNSVLEIGCGDAFCSRIVQHEVHNFTAVDFDPVLIEEAKACMLEDLKFDCFVHDITNSPLPQKFDGIYALDVLEHINKELENNVFENIVNSLALTGSVIIGMPSLESQYYASEQSKSGHINCKNGLDLKLLLEKYFHNVFVFSMNDEVVHTGFFPMAHYLLALCCGKKI